MLWLVRKCALMFVVLILLEETVKTAANGRRKRSYLWNFFVELSPTVTKCKICSMKLKKNMSRHLRLKHSKVYDQMNQFLETKNSSSRRKRSYLWNFFEEISPTVTKCKICKKKLKKNMSRHLRLKHSQIYGQMNQFLEPRNITKGGLIRSTSWVKGSWAKRYCKKIGDQKYQCNICDAVLSLTHGLFSNMKRHIKNKHPYVYEQEISGETSDVKEDTAASTYETDSKEYQTEFLDSDNDNDNCHEEENCVWESDIGKITDGEVFLDETDSEFELKIKYLIMKPVSGKKRAKNCMWNFFNVIEENHLYSCLACNKRIAIFPHSIANLKRHIKGKHAKQFQLMMKYVGEGGSNEKDSPVSFDKYYFEKEDDTEYKCKECGQLVISSDEDQQTLFDHIKDIHPDQILAYQEEIMENDDEFEDLMVKKDD